MPMYAAKNIHQLIHSVQFLHNNRSCSAATVADGSNTILASLQLVQKRRQNTGA